MVREMKGEGTWSASRFESGWLANVLPLLKQLNHGVPGERGRPFPSSTPLCSCEWFRTRASLRSLTSGELVEGKGESVAVCPFVYVEKHPPTRRRKGARQKGERVDS